MQFRSSSLDVTTGRLRAPTSKRRGRYGGTSLDVFSRNRKEKARARVALLPLWQGARLLLQLYVQLGRGQRCRSWWYDQRIADEMNRSGIGCYGVDHVRKCRRLLEDVGLIRSTYVRPHSTYGCLGADKCPCGHFPSSKAPDVDGGGAYAPKGGRVVEVNLAGILGLGELWQGPLREMGWLDAREAREATDAAPEPQPEAREIAPPAAPEAALNTRAESGNACPDRVGMHAHSYDLGSPSENASDHGRSRPEPAPGSRVPLRGTERPANAGRRPEAAPLDATPTAARAALDAPPPNGPPRPSPETRTLEGRGEQAARQGPKAASKPRGAPPEDTLSVYLALAPKNVRGFVADMVGRRRPPDAPETQWTEGEAPRPLPAPPTSGGAGDGAPPGPRLLFEAQDVRPVGRHGERPPGWRGGGRRP